MSGFYANLALRPVEQAEEPVSSCNGFNISVDVRVHIVSLLLVLLDDA